MDKIPDNLQPGDIAATKGRGLVGWVARRIFTPSTDRFHHFLIGSRTFDNDWVIFESISKGIAVGRLSFYKDKDVKFYRVNCPDEIRQKIVDQITKYGRSSYDYWFLLRILLSCLVVPLRILVRERRFRRLTADDLPYTADAAYICTEAVDIPYWDLGFTVVPKTRATIPSAIRQAELEGRITEITKVGEGDKGDGAG